MISKCSRSYICMAVSSRALTAASSFSTYNIIAVDTRRAPRATSARAKQPALRPATGLRHCRAHDARALEPEPVGPEGQVQNGPSLACIHIRKDPMQLDPDTETGINKGKD